MTAGINKFFKNDTTLNDSQKKAYKMNRIQNFVFNIILLADSVTFDVITKFFHLETITISKVNLPIWEQFISFRNVRNAVNVLTAISEGRKMNDEVFKLQSKITPKDGVLKAMYFNEFMASLSEKQVETLLANLNKWYEANQYDIRGNFFDIAHHTGRDGELKNKQYIQFLSYGQSVFAKVLLATDNSWVTIVGEGFADPLMIGSNYRVVKGSQVPSEIKKEIDATFNKFDESGKDANIKALENLIKKEAEKEAKEKAEKEAKKEAIEQGAKIQAKLKEGKQGAPREMAIVGAKLKEVPRKASGWTRKGSITATKDSKNTTLPNPKINARTKK